MFDIINNLTIFLFLYAWTTGVRQYNLDHKLPYYYSIIKWNLKISLKWIIHPIWTTKFTLTTAVSCLSKVWLPYSMFTFYSHFLQPNLRSNENLLMFGVMFIWMAAIMIAIPSAKLYDTYSFPEEPEKEFCHPGTWFIHFKTCSVFFEKCENYSVSIN